jgi:hypothetical protein
VFEAVERALAGQRLAIRSYRRLQFPYQHRKRRVLAQLVVIDEILVTQYQTVDPLPNQRLYLVRDKKWITTVAKARRKPPNQVAPPLN